MAAYYRTLSGERSQAWRGGSGTLSRGYLVARRNGKTVSVHRAAMEEHLGRPLLRSEKVHHINGDKSDNRIENLELCQSQSEHISKHHAKAVLQPKRCLFCDKPPLSRGLCSAHYKKARRKGVLHAMPRFHNP